MSGSTTTPNLGLKKPVYDSDEEQWGYDLNSNSDILDAVLATTTAGTFVPLAGGTMTGPLVLNGNATAPLNPVTLQQLNAAAGVTSWNARTGAVSMTLADVTGVGGAPLASPAFTGTPSLPTGTTGITQTAGNSTTALATTAFVTTALGGATGGATVGDVAPASPSQGALWWDSIGGQMYVRYTDANSSQWVVANSQPAGISDAPNDANTYARHAASWVASPTNASVAAAVAPALNNVGRSFVHNGLFNIAQRGAGPWTTNGAFTADRWQLLLNLDTMTVSLTPFAITGTTGDEAATTALWAQVTGNAGAASYSLVQQNIEGIKRLSGKTVTISFVAYLVSGTTAQIGVGLQQNFGTGGSPSAPVQVNATVVTISTTPARYSVTLAVPSVAGKTLGTNGNDSTGLKFFFSAGSSNSAVAGVGVQTVNAILWGVQLEIGPTATPLEKLDPALQLQQAQRFYQTDYFGTAYNSGGAGWGIDTTIPLRVQMRSAPTCTFNIAGTPPVTGVTLGAFTTGVLGLHYVTNAAGASGMALTYFASADL
jgi:hypothetical protein